MLLLVMLTHAYGTDRRDGCIHFCDYIAQQWTL